MLRATEVRQSTRFLLGGGAGVLQRTIQAPIAPTLGRGGGDGDVWHTLSYV